MTNTTTTATTTLTKAPTAKQYRDHIATLAIKLNITDIKAYAATHGIKLTTKSPKQDVEDLYIFMRTEYQAQKASSEQAPTEEATPVAPVEQALEEQITEVTAPVEEAQEEEVTMTTTPATAQDVLNALPKEQQALIADYMAERVMNVVIEQEEELPQVDVTENVETLFNGIMEERKALGEEIELAYANGNEPKAKELMKQQKRLHKQAMKLSGQFPAAELFTSYRNATAENLRKSAKATRTYGHKFVDGTMEIVNEILGAGFKVVETTVSGSKRIVGKASLATGKLSHFAVDQAANAQEGLANVIEVKEVK